MHSDTPTIRTASALFVGLLAGLGVAAVGARAQTAVITFDNGLEGWSGPGGVGGATTIVATGGHGDDDGPFLRTVFNDFGITFRTTTNTAFLGDYTTSDEATIGVDTRVEFLSFFGQDVSRPWLVELRNRSLAQGFYPWVSVWYLFDNISQTNNSDWTPYSVTFSPRAADLPPGWGGTGDEDPVTFEPTLPAGVGFADVLSNIDEVVFTTLQPGFFFGFTDHTVGLDNIRIERVGVCVADFNGDGQANIIDVVDFIANWNTQGPGSDFNDDGAINISDVVAFITNWNFGCP